jgi:hypothetical protein
MPYKFRVWCRDCCLIYQDPYGCFGGAWELSEEVYDTVEQAVEAADEFVKDCNLWEYDIVEVDPENPNRIVRQYDEKRLVPFKTPDGRDI